MKSLKLASLLLVLGLAIGGCNGEQTPARGVVPEGEIAFVRVSGRSSSLFLVDAATGELTRLTEVTEGRLDSEPAWSPDGSRLAFCRGDSLRSNIILLDVERSTQISLTTGWVHNCYPSWAPRRGRIAFTRATSTTREIYLVDADGSNLSFLAEGSHPRWSPTAEELVFDDWRYLYLISADGTEQKRFDAGLYLQSDHAWAPGGERIAFGVEDWDDSRRGDIMVVNRDGTGLTNLTNGPGLEYSPRWSPDGSRIAFLSVEDPEEAIMSICVMNSDGTQIACLREGSPERVYGGLNWSPDGDWLVFYEARASDRDGENNLSVDSELYLIRVDGTEVITLTDGPDYDTMPVWRP